MPTVSLVRRGRILALWCLAWSFVAFPATGHEATGNCAIPLSSESVPRASDCLYVLKSAVGAEDCAACVCDVSGNGVLAASDALLCLMRAVGRHVVLACPACTTTTTTTTLPPDPCPAALEWTTLAGLGRPCATNDDCVAGSCDPERGRCRTATDLDLGWSGQGHDQDLAEGGRLRLRLECASGDSTCGVCDIAGIDPAGGNCRCANDPRQSCDQPAADDPLHCTASMDQRCLCYDGPPVPLLAAGTPLCMVLRLDADVTGTVDVDTGANEVGKRLRALVYNGESLAAPCPVCGGRCSDTASDDCVFDSDCAPGATCLLDPEPGDGLRGGTCIAGQQDGLDCDVDGFHGFLPVETGPGIEPTARPAGAGYSLDCLPDAGKNTSGSGLAIRLTESTGAGSLVAGLSCGGLHPDRSCHCLLCSGDGETPCSSDAECASQQGRCSAAGFVRCSDDAGCAGVDVGPCKAFGARNACTGLFSRTCATNADCVGVDVGPCEPSTCTDDGGAGSPQPNSCIDFLCDAGEDGEGTCATGPDAAFCDGAVRADGRGIWPCASNGDCAPDVVGFDNGTCTLVDRARCFADSIAADGEADPRRPLEAGAFCMGPLSTSGRNAVLGLPGPGRLRRQVQQVAWCASDPARAYEPGVGGCLP